MGQLTEIYQTLRARYFATLKRTGKPATLTPLTKGGITSVKTVNGQMRVAGWYEGPSLELVSNGVVTALHRDQKPRRTAVSKTGFNVPISAATRVFVQTTDSVDILAINLFNWRSKITALLQTMLFLPMLALKNPVIVLRFLLLNDRQAAGVLEQILLRPAFSKQPVLFDMSIFNGSAAVGPPLDDVSIILPVFNSFSLLQECLTRVLAHTKQPFKLIIVEDCSSDPRIRPWLRNWQKHHHKNVTLLENDHNLGFIKSVNRGISLAKGDHVVLLNSDALVPENWLERLMAPIYKNNKIASTTPLSNNAEILSVPVIGKENPMLEGAIDRIDALAKKLNGRVPCIEIPTGVGFCMGLNKTYLQKIPSLDLRFGKGYGEEVDWCQKTRQLGGKHMAVTNLFVQHIGGESFGSEKQMQLAKNNAVITRLYPRFQQLVREFSDNDPLHSTRVALAVAMIDTGQPVPIYLAHSMGGGTEIYLQNRIKTDLNSGQGSIIIRDDPKTGMLRFEVYSTGGKIAVLVKSFKNIHKLLSPIRKRALIYACFVGARHPVKSMHGFLENLTSDDDSFCLQLHDFFAICPSYNLLDTSGSFCSVPNLPACADCYKTKAFEADTSQPTIQAWRNSWAAILEKTNHIDVFSQSSAAIFVKAYPKYAGKIRVIPHRLPKRPAIIMPQYSQIPIIGVLGNIGYNKGAAVINRAADISPKGNEKLIVFGNLDPNFSHKNIQVTGTYQLKDLAKLARANKINCWLIPSIWPETFSFTTHEALATGLPVFAFDLGAQAEAVKKAPNGYVIDNNPDALFANIKTCLDRSCENTLVD